MKFYDFLTDPTLGALGDPTYRALHVCARLIDGDAHLLSREDLALAKRITGRTRFSSNPTREIYLILGRRSGKSLFASRVALWCCVEDWRTRLAIGEMAVAACVAVDRKQAGVLFGYAYQCARASPMMSAALTRATADVLEFGEHQTTFEVHTATFRGTRGRTFSCVVVDEASFLPQDDSAEPDRELIRAVKPGLATLDGILAVISSPYLQTGVVGEAHTRHFAVNKSPALYITGPTRTFNPTIPQSTIDRALAEDPEAARAEWLGEFRTDLTAAYEERWITRAVSVGITIRPFSAHHEGASSRYYAFTDPAGGSGRDSWATAIVHKARDRIVVDALLDIRPPFSTGEAASRVAGLCRTYALTSVTGDHYGGDWPAEALQVRGITYLCSPLPKSDLYREAIATFSNGLVDLLDDARLIRQLRTVQRRAQPGGRSSFDCPKGSPDDCSNAVVGAIWLAQRGSAAAEVLRAMVDAAEQTGEDPFLIPSSLPSITHSGTFADYHEPSRSTPGGDAAAWAHARLKGWIP